MIIGVLYPEKKGGLFMASYPAQYVADYTISYCTRAKCPISNLKLQKMLYFLWVDYYKETKCELYLDDICAWKLGPVVPNVYYNFCSYAGTPIALERPSKIEETDTGILDSIIKRYLLMPASTLVNMTHTRGKPWERVYQDGIGNRSVIPFSLIKDLECSAQC